MVLAAAPLAAQPFGPSLVAGQAQVSSFGATTYVNQSTNKAIINWQDFSVSAGSAVQFNQPSSSSITLNRVTGSGISNIDGSIRSNGQVWLLNPNGLLFGSGASINVGGLLAATSDIANRDFEDGRYNFTGGRGGIVNNGVIKASNGGSVILSAPSVTNRGLIQASAGHVVLGGTDTFTVDFNGDHLLSYAVGANSSGGSVTNTGKISTPGGRVLLTARAASDVRDAVINNTGMIEATSVREERGEIILEAEGGGVSNSGTIDVSGKGAGEVGGTVKVLGNAVAIEDGANIDASGHAGGGTVLIGGNSRGEGFEINAQSARVGNAAINASAIATGNGGKVVVYSTGNTTVSASITAKGGALSGNGGAIETSGHLLSLSGISVDAGLGGDWLLDPFDLTVTSGDAVTINNTLNAGTNVTLETSASGASGAGSQNASGYGDIYIEAPISWSSAAQLNLSAYRDINFNASITISGAGSLSIVTANAGNNIGDYRIRVGEKIQYTSTTRAINSNGRSSGLSVGRGLISGGALIVNSNSFEICNSATTCTENLTPSGKYALGKSLDVAGMGTPTQIGASSGNAFTGIYEGLGNTVSNLSLDSAGGIFNYSTGVIRDVGLINVSISSGSNPEYFGGLVNHNGGMILNSTISLASGFSPNGMYIGGLVGENTSTGQIINSSATGFITAVYAGGSVGGLVATNSGLIKNSASYVQVTHSSSPYWSGGLVGWNGLGATIQNSLAAGSVSATVSMNVGGLAGGSEGLIKDSSSTATMDVRNGVSVGGLVGYTASTSSIQGSSASGTFTLGANSVGGLVGEGLGSIDNSWTAGIFDFSPSPSNANAGGLVGKLRGVITNSHSNANLGSATTVVSSIGGLVGTVESSGSISGSYSAVSIVSPAGKVGGLVGRNYGVITTSGSASDLKWTGSNAADVGLGGLVGGNSTGGQIKSSFSAGLILIDSAPIGSSYSAGGLVGRNDGSIENTYSLASLRGSQAATGPIGSVGAAAIGGLVGRNYTNGTIQTSFSVGTVVSYGNAYVGGAVGENTTGLAGKVINTYWDIDTSGLTSDGLGSYAAGLHTGALQGAIPLGFSSSIWGFGPNLYPYISSQGSPKVISGTLYGASGAMLRSNPGNGIFEISVLNNGQKAFNTTVGANGYYYIIEPFDVVSSNDKVLIYINNTLQQHGFLDTSDYGAKANVYIDNIVENLTNVDIFSNKFRVLSSATSLSDISGGLLYALGDYTESSPNYVDILYRPGSFFGSTDPIVFMINGIAKLEIISSAAGGINLNKPLITGDYFSRSISDGAYPYYSLSIIAKGNVTQSSNIFANNVNITTPGDIVISPGASIALGNFYGGGEVILRAGKNFINNSGLGAETIKVGTGVFKIFSQGPAGNTFGGLNSNNEAIWNTNYLARLEDLPGSSASSATSRSASSATSRYIFAFQPTITASISDATKIYGIDNSSAISGSYTLTGLQPGVSGAYLSDSAANIRLGSVVSLGSAVSANVGTYAINLLSGTVPTGYSLSVRSGTLTVSPATLTYLANAATRIYGSGNPQFSGDVVGFVNNDTRSSAVSGELSFSSSAANSSLVGSYSVIGSGLSAANYVFTQAAGNSSALTVTEPPPQVVTKVIVSNVLATVQASVRGALTTTTVSASFASLPVPSAPVPAPPTPAPSSPAASSTPATTSTEGSSVASAPEAPPPASSTSTTNQKSAPIIVAMTSTNSPIAPAPQAPSPLAANNAEAPISSDGASASLASSLGDEGPVKSESGNGSNSDSKEGGKKSSGTGRSSTSTASGGRRGVATVLIPGFLTAAPPPPPPPPLDNTSLPAFGNLALWQ